MTKKTSKQGVSGISSERELRPGQRSQAKKWGWLLPILLLAPLELGAKGCDSGTVGDDCAAGTTDPKCTTTGGASTGTGGSANTGGKVNTGGKTSTGGSANTGGNPSMGTVCGGLLGASCAKGEYCDFPLSAQCGAADQTGICKPKPNVCDDIFQPVCGCDDMTYSNACEAAAAGVAVATQGACASDGTDCGGLLGLTCAKGEYCNYPLDAQCGAADQTGVCTPVAEVCTADVSPVCGCDGKTYSNACVAARNSVSVASLGECSSNPTGTSCGGLKPVACATGEFCNYPITAQCGAADQTGTCTKIPAACDAVLDPVCGCNGKTYDNACAAATAGVSVSAKGACAATGKACGARLGNTCASTQYCQFAPEAICGRADATGTCTAIPTGCTKELAEVCGCNGVTYSNACVAASAGVSVDYVGRCKTTSPGAVCGGLLGTQCADATQYCAFPLKTQCGSGDQTGTCTTKPQACTEQYDPVCGCDGKTYGNACSAASAGMSVAADGECK